MEEELGQRRTGLSMPEGRLTEASEGGERWWRGAKRQHDRATEVPVASSPVMAMAMPLPLRWDISSEV